MEGVIRNPWRIKHLIIGWVLIFLPKLLGVTGAYAPSPWKSGAHATFYENANGGACGYGNSNDYGTSTTAVSTTVFNNGNACGQCFQLKCVGSKWCYPFSPTITVTATNLCPPNWYVPSNAGGWCNPPRTHFDLSKTAFMRFAVFKAGIVPVSYRRVACARKGGVRFKFQGNANWLLVYVSNVAGSGDVGSMWVKGSRTGWIKMSRNWGAAFQAFSPLGGQTLSFKLQSGYPSKTIICNNVASGYWSSGQMFQANNNF